MRIGLNLLHALPEIGGGWNYIDNLVSAVGEYDRENEYIAFVTSASERLIPHSKNFRKVFVRLQSTSRPKRIFYENTLLQAMAHRHDLDCMHWFANTKGIVNSVPAVVTVHDLQPFLRYADFSLIKRIYLRLMLTLTTRSSALLLPVSGATAQALMRQFQVDSQKMIVISAIVLPQFKPATDDSLKVFRCKHGLPRDFWLYVAHWYPHKNHVRLLRAYHGFKKTSSQVWPLVLRGDPRGAEDDIHHAIDELDLEKDVIILPRLEYSELPTLYSSASALVFPSLYEGGGIPVIEAMACGCPVLASDIAPVREFANEAAYYFDPLDIEAIADGMRAFQNNQAGREKKRIRGLQRAEAFRPRPVVKRLMEAYAIIE